MCSLRTVKLASSSPSLTLSLNKLSLSWTCSSGWSKCSALLMTSSVRGLAADTTKTVNKKPSPAPGQISSDYIGPPDPDSNLRPLKFHIPSDESAAERRFRESREDTQKWNQEFWAQHNRNFAKQKEAFIQRNLSELRLQNPHDADRRLTAEELSVFYKQFLDGNYKTHRQYNREWYKRNAGLLGPAFQVFIQRLFKRSR